MVKDYDFSGYATRNDLTCGDGRVIRKNAFKSQDGQKVPLIWNHEHNDPEAVIGHAILENRDDGVYAYCKFNDTENGKLCHELVNNGDVRSLSIWANQLKQMGSDVVHGVIRELSLVLAGANPGAYIDFVLAHSDEETDSLYANYDESLLVLSHGCKKETKEESGYEPKKKTLEHAAEPEDETADEKEDDEKGEKEMAKSTTEVFNTLNDEQKKLVRMLVKQAQEDVTTEDADDMKHSAAETKTDNAGKEKTVGEIFDTLTEDQKTAVYAIIGQILSDKENGEADKNEGGTKNMKHNVFDQDVETNNEVLSHSEFNEIMEDAENVGSLRKTFLQHGITNIGYLLPDTKTLESQPAFIKRDDSWVAEFMGAVRKSPFSRVKSVFADITEADARAKGYIKGNEKADELFSLLKRETTPTTVYKKQSIDRDDTIDITDLDVIAWLKSEMRMMLDEEIARAILVGDGRTSSSQDKINEQNIRPIWTDDDKFTIKANVNVTTSTTADEKAQAFIKASIKSRKNYKGSGNPIMYMSEDMLTDCLLLQDTTGRDIYDSVEKLATKLRVRKIVTVPVMENLTRVVGDKTHTLAGIYVNPADYNVGADKGGSVNMFDDFDIDFNKQKYLIETRCSGALIKPYAAVAIEFVQPTSELG